MDTINFFERVLFCFLSGNGDMHLKNWALLGAGQEVALAPCYDLVCSRLYIKDEADTALTAPRMGRSPPKALTRMGKVQVLIIDGFLITPLAGAERMPAQGLA